MRPRTPTVASASRPLRVAGAVITVLAVAPRAAADPDPPRPDLRNPLNGVVSVVTPFDPPAERWLTGHRGVDLAVDPLETILAPADGAVLFAGAVGGRPVLSIEHAGGVRTTFEPVRAIVRPGDRVVAGEPVGHVVAGHPGCPVVACLHWGARVTSGKPSGDDDDYVDPLSLVAVHDSPIRLKPTQPGDEPD